MKVLITGGATWVKIDRVRILTNVFTGKTSVYLASYFKRRNCKVTLLLNTHCINKLPQGIKIIPFRYFQDLRKMLIKELKQNQYDIIIHTAAVSDYLFKHPLKGKLPSGRGKLTIKLSAAPKLTHIIRRYAKGAYLVQFKLESSGNALISRAKKSLNKNKFDLVVANALNDLENNYHASIINKKGIVKEISSKRELAKTLLDTTRTNLNL